MEVNLEGIQTRFLIKFQSINFFLVFVSQSAPQGNLRPMYYPGHSRINFSKF